MHGYGSETNTAEIKPIFRRAASTKAGRMQRSLSLGARAELQNAFGKDGGGSQWFLPVDENDVSPVDWVDEWCDGQPLERPGLPRRMPLANARTPHRRTLPRSPWTPPLVGCVASQAERSRLRGGVVRLRSTRPQYC